MKNFIKKRYSDIFILTIGFILSCAGALYIQNTQQEKEKENFYNLVDKQFIFIKNNFEWHLETLENISNFILSTGEVNDLNFYKFTNLALERHQSFDALGWINHNTRSDNYSWSHVEPQGEKKKLAYAQIDENKNFYTIVKQSMAESIKENLLTSGNFTPEKDDMHVEPYNQDNKMHFLILHPVYKLEKQAKKQNLLGMAFSIIDLEKFLNEINHQGTKKFNTIKIEFSETDKSRQILLEEKNDGAREFYKAEKSIKVDNKQIVFTFVPTRDFLNNRQNYHDLFIFLLIFTLSICALSIKNIIFKLEKARTKALEANNLKSEFLATMSHEIRSPMSGVLGMAELLLETGQTFEQKNYTKTIINCGESLLNVIEDILDFSKIEANKLELYPVPVDMMELVDDVCALYFPKAREKALELAVHYVPGSERFVYADAVRIKQILCNLVNNAIKFTEKGHIIIMVQQNRETDTLRNEGKITLNFSVADTGIGISKAEQNYIFEKFSQVESSATRNYGGAGLGLSISKRLTEMMGGFLTVKSVPGAGSEFSFALPLTLNSQESTPVPIPKSLNNIKILIVDDLPVVRTIVSEQLLLSHARCAVAESGLQALDMMRQAQDVNDPYQMVLIDYLMPGMNGEMLARAISDDPQHDNICLVMLTAAGNHVIGDKFLERGFSAYISKPVISNTLTKYLEFIWKKFNQDGPKAFIRPEEYRLISDKAENNQAELKNVKILLAEDSRINQAFAQEVLESMGAQIVIASNGQEAIDILSSQPDFDIVLMDCQMPVLDGFEATRIITSLQNQGTIPANIPVIALTANAMAGDRKKCIDAGMKDYLSKPVRRMDLKKSVLQWLPQDKIIQQSAQLLNEEKQTPPEKRSNILDNEILKKVSKTFKGNFNQIMQYFIEDVQKYIADIEKACLDNNTETAQRAAHTIKSSSAQMGAFSLSECAKTIEYYIRSTESTTDLSSDQELKNMTHDLKNMFIQTQRIMSDFNPLTTAAN